MTFEKIVKLIKKKARVISHRRETKKKNRRFHRVRITIEVGKKSVNLFHNSRAGYRAQYYHSIQNGERANKYLIRQICPRMLYLLDKNHKRTCKPAFIKASLLGLYSKAWIYQGLWYRRAKTEDQILHLERWDNNKESLQRKYKDLLRSDSLKPSVKKRFKRYMKLPRLGSLAPSNETCIDLKGTFVDSNGTPIRKDDKPNRGQEIHKYGFT